MKRLDAELVLPASCGQATSPTFSPVLLDRRLRLANGLFPGSSGLPEKDRRPPKGISRVGDLRVSTEIEKQSTTVGYRKV